MQDRRDTKSGIDVMLIVLGGVLKVMRGVLDAPEIEIQKSSLVPCVGVRRIDLQSGIQRLLRLLRPSSGNQAGSEMNQRHCVLWSVFNQPAQLGFGLIPIAVVHEYLRAAEAGQGQLGVVADQVIGVVERCRAVSPHERGRAPVESRPTWPLPSV